MFVHSNRRSRLAFHPPDNGLGQRRGAYILPRLVVAAIHGGDKAAEGAGRHRAANARCWNSYPSVAEDIGAALVELGDA